MSDDTFTGTVISTTDTPYWFTCLVIHDTDRDCVAMRYSDDVANLSEPDNDFPVVGDVVEYQRQHKG